MTETYNIPEPNSLDSMEGVKNELESNKNIDEQKLVIWFEIPKKDFDFAVKVEDGVKKNLGKFDIFTDNFFWEVYKQRELLKDYNPRKKEFFEGTFYFSLDIFNRLLEKDLLTEDDKDTFCFAFSDSYEIQREIERYLRNTKPDIDILHIIIKKYLPNIEKLASLKKIDEIDAVIRERCFELKLANEFAVYVYNIGYKATTLEDWEREKEKIWRDFISEDYVKVILKRCSQYAIDDFDKFTKFARHVQVEEVLVSKDQGERVVTVNWRDIVMKGLNTFGKDESLDFYSLKKLQSVLLEIKNEYGF